jgi:hypothetical protein
LALRPILLSDDLAWDVVQEKLCSLWGEAVIPPNLRSWLIRAVVLRSLALARSRSRRLKHDFLACRGDPEASGRDEPATQLERADLLGTMPDLPAGTVRFRLNRSREGIGRIFPAEDQGLLVGG